MSLRKFMDWCISDRGRLVASYVATGSIACVGMGHFLPQTVFIEYYVDFLQRYNKGLSVPVSAVTKEKFEKVLDMLQIPSEKKPLFRPFNVIGFDVRSIGTSFSKWGVRVGIPGNFDFKREIDIDTSRIKLGGENLVWGTEAGKKLLKSFVISENAQYYAIAKEIKMRDTPKFLIDTITGISSALATYALANSLNKKFNFYVKPFLFRAALYTLVCSFTLGNYFLIKDLSQVYYEQSIDKEIKEKYPILAEGAKEYYTKLLLRNMCLRIILEKDGEKLYSPLGNINYFIRTKSTPLMQRREFFD
ncbi:hypothetical protein HHI36_017970 [Cryptolaemus montrouzieri]|uniref:Transmembrane protein 177 n=1 Tax=Cryptolaemus montrouzieri TaxID=559131 RepID=A0ABD2NYW3_9CUCU